MKPLSCLWVLVCSGALLEPARGNVYNVTGTADGSGTVTPTGGGNYNATTLRAAVGAATSGGPHTINLPSGIYTLTGGELQLGVTGNLSVTINGTGGPGNTVIAHDTTKTDARIFNLDPNLSGGVNVTLQQLTLTHGRNSDGNGGAGIICGWQGGNGTQPDSTTLVNCILTDNRVSGTTGAAIGGAIQNLGGTLILNGCSFSSNSAGVYSGGAVYFDTMSPSAGTLMVANSAFTNNVAGGGSGAGGLYVAGAAGSTLSVSNSLFCGNQTTGSASGGAAVYKDGAATLNLTACAFVTNHVLGAAAVINEASGGALDNNTGPATLSFCRLEGNTTALSNKGSAVYNAVGNGAVLTANNDWWSSETGPGAGVFESGGGNGSVGSWLLLKVVPGASQVEEGTSVGLTATFATNSAGAYIAPANLLALAGLPINFGSPVDGTLANAQTFIGSAGTATATFNAGATAGTGGATATVDGVSAQASLTVEAPPHVTLTGTLPGNGLFEISFPNATPGAVFTVLTSTDPRVPLTNWTVLGSATNNGVGGFSFFAPFSAGEPQRYYRIRTP